MADNIKSDASLLAEVLYKMAQDRNELSSDLDSEKYYRAEAEKNFKMQQSISNMLTKDIEELRKQIVVGKEYRDKLIADGAELIEQHAKKIKDVRATLEETIRTLVEEKQKLRERGDRAAKECVDYYEDLRIALRILKKNGLTAQFTDATYKRDNRKRK